MADSSLQDFILKRGMQRTNKPFVKRPANNFSHQPQLAPLQLFTAKKTVGDARNRIISSKRSKITDARDKLSQIAKTGDARDRLNKKRKNIGAATNVMKMVATNPGVVVKRTIGNTATRSSLLDAPRHAMAEKPTRVTIKNEQARVKAAYNAPIAQPRKEIRTRSPQRDAGKDEFKSVHLMQEQLLLEREKLLIRMQQEDLRQKQRELELQQSSFMQLQQQQHMQPQRYNQPVPYEEAPRPARLKITTSNEYNVQKGMAPPVYMDNDYMDEPPRMPIRKRPFYDNGSQMYPRQNRPVQSTVVVPARQSAPNRNFVPQQQPILNMVIVNNLSDTVSLQDLEELFGTIGPLISFRIVRPGVAEVQFVSSEDAHASVALYNNRQLDGQVMRVSIMGGGGAAARGNGAAVARSGGANAGRGSVLKSARGGRANYY